MGDFLLLYILALQEGLFAVFVVKDHHQISCLEVHHFYNDPGSGFVFSFFLARLRLFVSLDFFFWGSWKFTPSLCLQLLIFSRATT